MLHVHLSPCAASWLAGLHPLLGSNEFPQWALRLLCWLPYTAFVSSFLWPAEAPFALFKLVVVFRIQLHSGVMRIWYVEHLFVEIQLLSWFVLQLVLVSSLHLNLLAVHFLTLMLTASLCSPLTLDQELIHAILHVLMANKTINSATPLTFPSGWPPSLYEMLELPLWL